MWDLLTIEEILKFMQSPEADQESLKEATHQLAIRGVTATHISTDTENKKSDFEAMAALYTSSCGLAALTISALAGPQQTDAVCVADALAKKMKRMVEEEQANQNILAINAVTLEAIFNKMIRCAMHTDSLELTKAYMDIALRAQNQGRKTLILLEQLKNPKQQTFVAQQNIAQIQQVNNVPAEHPQTDNVLDPENGLLEAQDGEWLDPRTTNQTISTNPAMETMGALNGRQDSRR